MRKGRACACEAHFVGFVRLRVETPNNKGTKKLSSRGTEDYNLGALRVKRGAA